MSRGFAPALGWFVHEDDGVGVIHHGGSLEGFSSHIDFHPERTVIVLCNNEAGTASDLAWLIDARLRPAEPRSPSP